MNDSVYRGAQPTDEGFQSLAKLGVHAVIDLQESGSARAIGEEKAVKAAGMQYINVPMEGMQTPSNESVAKVLRSSKVERTALVRALSSRRGSHRRYHRLLPH